MPLKRFRLLAMRAAARHVSPETPGKAAPTTSGRHVAPRSILRRLIPAGIVAALILGCVATVTVHSAYASVNVHDAASTTTATTAPLPTPSASSTLAPIGTGVVDPAVKPYVAPKLLSEVPVGPGNVAKPVNTVLQSQTVITALDATGIPAVALQAYQHAAGVLSITDPGCHMPWELIAGIGRVESDHGQFGGAKLLATGYGTKPIYGIPLDGRPGVALIRDTDHGKLDGDPNFDRAVGPMQFIPSTWAVDGVDGNGDGKADPNNIFDAALAAANYLCKGGGNMTNLTQEEAAVRSYNDADSYVRVVIATAESYAHGDAATIPLGPTSTAGTGSEQGVNNGSLSGLNVPPATTTPATQAPHSTGTTTKPSTKPTTKPVTKPAPSSHPTQSSKPVATAPKPVTTAPKPVPTAPKPTTNPRPIHNRPTHKPTSAPMPTSAPSQTSSPTTPTTSTPTAAPTAKPRPSGAPTRIAPPSHHVRIGHVVNVGWAPAMRQVVVVILTTPKPAPGTHQDRPNTPSQPTPAATTPARPEGDHPTGRPTAQPTGKK